MWRTAWRRIAERLRRDFVAGLLVFVPVGFTIIGVWWIIDQLDRLVLPRIFSALGLESDQPPLLGTLVTLLLILVAGALTRSFVGRGALRLWERIVERIPVARSLYSVVKQFMQATVGEGTRNFSRVVLIEYPRRGVYCYAFVTGSLAQGFPGEEGPLTKVFVPSTPNPTTGYYLLLPDRELRETGLTIEEAFRLIISAGIATPGAESAEAGGPAADDGAPGQ
ncbi:MAG: DUF502 domain-containing protein [Myxococcota bacterium]|nr:DUF502 domain-containing protein [Myxococcota bacterium]